MLLYRICLEQCLGRTIKVLAVIIITHDVTPDSTIDKW